MNGILHVAGMRSGKNHIVQADSLSRYPFGLASAEPNEMCQRRVCNENLADRASNCSLRKRAGNEIYHSAYTSGMLFAIIWARIFRTSSHSKGKCYAKFHGNVKKAIAKNCNDPRTPSNSRCDDTFERYSRQMQVRWSMLALLQKNVDLLIRVCAIRNNCRFVDSLGNIGVSLHKSWVGWLAGWVHWCLSSQGPEG